MLSCDLKPVGHLSIERIAMSQNFLLFRLPEKSSNSRLRVRVCVNLLILRTCILHTVHTCHGHYYRLMYNNWLNLIPRFEQTLIPLAAKMGKMFARGGEARWTGLAQIPGAVRYPPHPRQPTDRRDGSLCSFWCPGLLPELQHLQTNLQRRLLLARSVHFRWLFHVGKAAGHAVRYHPEFGFRLQGERAELVLENDVHSSKK